MVIQFDLFGPVQCGLWEARDEWSRQQYRTDRVGQQYPARYTALWKLNDLVEFSDGSIAYYHSSEALGYRNDKHYYTIESPDGTVSSCLEDAVLEELQQEQGKSRIDIRGLLRRIG